MNFGVYVFWKRSTKTFFFCFMYHNMFILSVNVDPVSGYPFNIRLFASFIENSLILLLHVQIKLKSKSIHQRFKYALLFYTHLYWVYNEFLKSTLYSRDAPLKRAVFYCWVREGNIFLKYFQRKHDCVDSYVCTIMSRWIVSSS